MHLLCVHPGRAVGGVRKTAHCAEENRLFFSGETIFQKVATMLDLTMLKDLKFLHIVVGLGLVYTCSVSFSMVYPYFLQETVGLSRADTALCMSLLSGADILARLTIPVITTRMGTGARTTFVVGSLALAIIRSGKDALSPRIFSKNS